MINNYIRNFFKLMLEVAEQCVCVCVLLLFFFQQTALT